MDESEKVALFGSMCMPLFLVVIARSGYATTHQCGGCENLYARACFRRILAGALSWMEPTFSVTMYFDAGAKPVSDLWVGGKAFCLRVVDNELDASELMDMYEELIAGEKFKKNKQQLTDELTSIKQIHGKPPLELLVVLVKLNHYVCSGVTSSIARQFVAHCAAAIELRLLVGFGYRYASGDLSNSADAISEHAVIHRMTIWNSGNRYHMRNELARYKLACRKHFHNCKHISFCGPDGTKMGVDMNITCAAAMNQMTGKVAVTPPQVP